MTSRLLARLEDFRLLPFFVIVQHGDRHRHRQRCCRSPTSRSRRRSTRSSPSPAGPSSPACPNADLARRSDRPVRDDVPGDDQRAPRRGRDRVPLAAAAGRRAAFNYLVAPFVMLALANVFVADPELRTGLILYGLAPCIAMVIIFTYLAKGNAPMALVFVALNSVIQMLLIPVYARLLIGDVTSTSWWSRESVVLYLGLPLILGVVTRCCGRATRWRGGDGPPQAGPERALDPGPAVHPHRHVRAQGRPDPSAAGDRARDGHPDGRSSSWSCSSSCSSSVRACASPTRDGVAVAFNATGRDFEIAIAIAITAFSPTVALATVVGPLIEVPVMLVPRLGGDAPRARAGSA